MSLLKGRQDKQTIKQCLQILKLLELGDGEGDVSIQRVEGQISAVHKKRHRSIIKYKQEPCIYSKKVGAEE
jgi:hypothetical protein